jgi:hypothetical protein
MTPTCRRGRGVAEDHGTEPLVAVDEIVKRQEDDRVFYWPAERGGGSRARPRTERRERRTYSSENGSSLAVAAPPLAGEFPPPRRSEATSEVKLATKVGGESSTTSI